MGKRDFLEKLLDGAGVEWLPLGDVVHLQRGKRLVKKQLGESGEYAVYQNSMTPREQRAKLVIVMLISGQLMTFISA